MKLEEIEKLCNEATPGPWAIEVSSWASHVTTLQHPKDHKNPVIFYPPKEQPDAKFIGASRDLMPKLIAVAKAAKALTTQFEAYYNCAGYMPGVPNSSVVFDKVDMFGPIKEALKELEKE